MNIFRDVLHFSVGILLGSAIVGISYPMKDVIFCSIMSILTIILAISVIIMSLLANVPPKS